MSDPKGFLKYAKENAPRRPVPERVLDWKEVDRLPAEGTLKVQASRCMDCGVPFCQSLPFGCPVENLIPNWNDLVHRGRWREAVAELHRTNNFPEFTGRLCPAPCESACVLGIGSDPVSIRLTEWSIIDRAFTEGWVAPVQPAKRTKKRVAVVGSGPAGLAAAQQLCRMGHSVTVFEKSSKPGGLLRYGIPDFKMEKSVIDRRLEQMKSEGVKFRASTWVGRDISLTRLREDYDAVCLTLGAEAARDLSIPGRELGGIHLAMDFLVQSNRRISGEQSENERSIHARGKKVIIIGGGDTGSDCLGTAIRQGCASVVQFELMPEPPLSRSPQTPWPLWPMKLRTSHAHEEGGSREFSIATQAFVGDGQVRALTTQSVRWEKGGFSPIPGTEKEWPCDLVILALGFAGPDRTEALEALPFHYDSRGCLQTDDQYRTSVPAIFAAGDVRRGASLIVWAIAEGRKMADAVHRFLGV